jgi:hypothetical protein
MTAKVSRPVAIPDVQNNADSVFQAVMRLKEGYENLSRQRGDPGRWPVTFQDLIDMGVITPEQMNEQLQRRRV